MCSKTCRMRTGCRTAPTSPCRAWSTASISSSSRSARSSTRPTAGSATSACRRTASGSRFSISRSVGDDRGPRPIIDASGKKTSMNVDCDSTQGIAWAPSGQEVWFTCATKGPRARCWPARSMAASGRCSACRAPSPAGHRRGRQRAALARQHQRFGIRGLAPGETRERDLSWLDWGLPMPVVGRRSNGVVHGAGRGRRAGLQRVRARHEWLARGSSGHRSRQRDFRRRQVGHRRDVDIAPTQLVLMPTGAGSAAQADERRYRALERAVPAGREAFRFQRLQARQADAGLEAGARRRRRGARAARGRPRQVGTSDGTRIVGRGTDGTRMIYRIDQKGTPPEPLRGVQPGDVLLRFSADDRSLFFYRKDGTTGSVDVFRLDPAPAHERRCYTIVPPSETVSLGGVGSLVRVGGRQVVPVCLRDRAVADVPGKRTEVTTASTPARARRCSTCSRRAGPARRAGVH